MDLNYWWEKSVNTGTYKSLLYQLNDAPHKLALYVYILMTTQEFCTAKSTVFWTLILLPIQSHPSSKNTAW